MSASGPSERPRQAKHRVSFSGATPIDVGAIASSSATSAATSTTTRTATSPKMPPQVRRSSLKSQPKPVVPKHLYQHKDPLLRRLRLRDPYGEGVDLRKEFRDTEVVGFLFGSSWSQGKVEEFYKERCHSDASSFGDIVAFTRSHPHRFKCIYCSVDTDEAAFKQNTANRPWLAMEWADGSNLPVAAYEDAAEPVLGSLANGEDFLLAGEEDTETDFVNDDVAGDGYTRPFARVHLARHWDVWSVPTLVVYHIPSRKVLSNRVRPEMLKKDKEDETWKKWEAGQSAELSVQDMLISMRWTLALLVVSIIYAVSVYSGGTNYLQNLLLTIMTPAMEGRPSRS